MTSFKGLLAAALIGGVISAGAVIGYQEFNKKPAATPQFNEIVTVDLEAVMRHKKQDITRKFMNAYTHENAIIAEEEAKAFRQKVEEGIYKISRNHILFDRKAVISHAIDVTAELIAYAEQASAGGTPAEPNSALKTKIGNMLNE